MENSKKLFLILLLVSVVIISGCAQQGGDGATQKKTVKAITKLTITSRCILEPKPCETAADLNIAINIGGGGSVTTGDRFIIALDEQPGTTIPQLDVGGQRIDLAQTPRDNREIIICIGGKRIGLPDSTALPCSITVDINDLINHPLNATIANRDGSVIQTFPLTIPPGTFVPEPSAEPTPADTSTSSPISQQPTESPIVLIQPTTSPQTLPTSTSQILPSPTSDCTVTYTPPKESWTYGPCVNGQRVIITKYTYTYKGTDCKLSEIAKSSEPCGNADSTASPGTSPSSTSQTLPTSTSSPTSTASPTSTTSSSPSTPSGVQPPICDPITYDPANYGAVYSCDGSQEVVTSCAKKDSNGNCLNAWCSYQVVEHQRTNCPYGCGNIPYKPTAKCLGRCVELEGDLAVTNPYLGSTAYVAKKWCDYTTNPNTGVVTGAITSIYTCDAYGFAKETKTTCSGSSCSC